MTYRSNFYYNYKEISSDMQCVYCLFYVHSINTILTFSFVLYRKLPSVIVLTGLYLGHTSVNILCYYRIDCENQKKTVNNKTNDIYAIITNKRRINATKYSHLHQILIFDDKMEFSLFPIIANLP